MNKNEPQAAERTPEEVAWDQEFKDEPYDAANSLSSGVRGLVRFAVKLPRALMEIPAAMVPEETTRHARAAAREGFLAVRSLLSVIGDNIENALAEPDTTKPTVKGPPGTWGTGRAAPPSSAQPSNSRSKAKRIELSDGT